MFAACDCHYEDAAPNAEIGSTLNFFENMCIAFIDKALNDGYEGGTQHEYGIKQAAASYEFAQTNTLATDEVKALADELSQKIASGEIVVATEPLHK